MSRLLTPATYLWLVFPSCLTNPIPAQVAIYLNLVQTEPDSPCSFLVTYATKYQNRAHVFLLLLLLYQNALPL